MTQAPFIPIAIALLILAAAGYMLFSNSNLLPGVSINNAPVSQAESTFLALTAQIDPVSFDISILRDPRFMRLQDIKTAIIPEAAGRVDPFAPFAK